MAGRKPKPAAVKKAQGNPGGRPIEESLVTPAIEADKVPAELHDDEHAAAEWRRIMPELIKHNLYSRLDRAALTAYCLAWSQMVRAQIALNAEGDELVYQSAGTKGAVMKRPNVHLQIVNQAATLLHKFVSEFGLSPVARLRLTGELQPDLFDDQADGKATGTDNVRGFRALGH